ncbi:MULTISPECIES: tetratricopeptide repeat protein [unclassified Microcoleus]|uniref:CHAT domain-containing protein n=1 Tax=unclassified Microcoleus TaxID=2642155 RepID=UPI001D7CFA86|nr:MULTISPECIES: tetratricopeptide repeat protein [unclassified Microcoleus]MCC3600056.1 tetratricopeptide repeat protein [Microcoleus sp. PH2017_26_ELK_O_A]MCC3625091.1 tetratricopeptide repeat protein [Microcoleus sp. PH2017_36_ELK_O_B]
MQNFDPISNTSDNYVELVESANLLLEQGDLEGGIVLFERASTLAEEAGEFIQQSAILNNLALVQDRLGLALAARDTLQRSLKILQRTNARNEHYILNNLGLIERNLGNLHSAKQYYQNAFQIVESLQGENLDCQVAIAQSLTNLGLVCKDLSQLTEARAYLAKALKLLEDSRVESFLCTQEEENECSYVANVLSALALTQEKLNDIEGARNYYLKARDAYERAQDYENEAITLHNLGQLCDNQNKLLDALEYYFQSLTINLAYDYKLGLAENLSAIAALICNANQIQPNLNHLPDIDINFSDIISAWVQQVKEVLADSNPSAPTALLSLIIALAQTNSIDQMRLLYEHILSLHQEIGYRLGQVKTLVDQALLNRDAEELDQSEQNLTDALVLAEEIAAPDVLYDIYFERGDIRMMAGAVSQAIEDYAAAVDAAESIRANLLLEEEALDYFAWPNLAAYDRLVRIEARLNHSKQALLWAETAKSREFLRRLRLSGVTRSHGVSEELTDREMQLMTQLHQAAEALKTVGEPDRLSALRNYEIAEQALRQVWDEIELFAPEYIALRQGKSVSWEELQRCLQV